MNTRLFLLFALGAYACAPDYDDAPAKLVGVGYDPEEIGPSPTPYGGVVEYSWVNFAGGGLSLALMGLGSFDEVGPVMAGYAPPYAAVYGFSYVFDTKLSAADSLGGVTSVPPEIEDSCYTTFDASGPIGSFKTVDLGSWLELRGTETTDAGVHEEGFRLDRYPGDYPADPQDAFVYYIGFDFWQPSPAYAKIATDETGRNPGSLEDVLVRTDNFPFGKEVEFRFPGAVARVEAPIASLPRPSASVEGGNTRYSLPSRPGGILVEWTGPVYDTYGHVLQEADEKNPFSTCLAYSAAMDGSEPVAATDCDSADLVSDPSLRGQVYTGPWDTDEGVTFRWTPGGVEEEGEAGGEEIVSLAVRFLGPIDKEDPNFKEHVVLVDPEVGAEAWNAARRTEGGIPADAEAPEGRRPPTPCEDGGEWVFDDAYETWDGELAPAMRGDPFHNVAELTCRLADDGEFTLTEERLADAIAYARRNGAQGAIFYFARSTEVEAKVPPAKDQYNQRLDITPVKVTSRAIDIGRFWFE
ncbi:MAG: hypothetical protein ACOZNI_09140 [Myxococcota bacterium]